MGNRYAEHEEDTNCLLGFNAKLSRNNLTHPKTADRFNSCDVGPEGPTTPFKTSILMYNGVEGGRDIFLIMKNKKVRTGPLRCCCQAELLKGLVESTKADYPIGTTAGQMSEWQLVHTRKMKTRHTGTRPAMLNVWCLDSCIAFLSLL